MDRVRRAEPEKAPVGAITIGVDVGQRRDPTAIAVAEADERGDATHFRIRFLERLPLGTSYPDVAARIAALARNLARLTQESQCPTLYVDATGVGQPLVDALDLARPPVNIVPVYFRHGDRRVEEKGVVTLGKAWLVSRLMVLLQGGRLHLPETSEARALARELLDFEIRVDENANEKYGAFQVGTHDDLVTAIGLATQSDGGRIGVWFA